MKYMLIDVTAVETTAVLAIATNPRVVLHDAFAHARQDARAGLLAEISRITP